LNDLYRRLPALHERDCEPEGYAWIDCTDADSSVIAYMRRAGNPDDFVVVVCNFTPIVRRGYRIGVPHAGKYREVLNTDSTHYGGSDVGNAGGLRTQNRAAHGMSASLSLTLPPLSVVVLQPEGA